MKYGFRSLPAWSRDGNSFCFSGKTIWRTLQSVVNISVPERCPQIIENSNKKEHKKNLSFNETTLKKKKEKKKIN